MSVASAFLRLCCTANNQPSEDAGYILYSYKTSGINSQVVKKKKPVALIQLSNICKYIILGCIERMTQYENNVETKNK